MKLSKTTIFETTSAMFDKDTYIKPQAILDVFQSAAGRHAYEMNIGADTLLKDNLGWITARQTIEIFATPFLFDQIEVYTFIHPRKKFEFLREYVAYDHNHKLLFRGISLWVILDFTTGRIRELDVYPEGEYEQNRNYDNVLKAKPVKNSGEKIKTYQVIKSDIDMYNHMNNTYYANLILDGAGVDSKDIKGLTLSYQSQAVLGDLIDIYREVNYDEKRIYVTGVTGDKIVFSSFVDIK